MGSTPSRSRRSWSRHDSTRLGIVLWFVVCWWIGSRLGGDDIAPFVRMAWPEATETLQLREDVYQAKGADGRVIGYVGVGSASGYGGPLSVAVAVDPEGGVGSLSVIRHRETPAFFDRVRRAGILGRLAGASHRDRIVLGHDVDGVSGATYTALALTQSVHRAVREIAAGEFDLPVPADERRIVFGVPELVLLGLFAVGIAQRRIRLRKRVREQVRWATLLVGLVVLGFVYNSPFVLAHINMVLIGYWPEWQTHLFWYILILGLLFFKATEEWNLYCYDFCPFGAAQDVLGLIGGAKSRPVRWSNTLVWAKRWLIAAAISLALIFRNPGLSSYEIFGTLFKLEGSDFQFALLAIMVIAAMFFQRPWCRYLCPLHRQGTEGLFAWTRNQVVTTWRGLRSRFAT